jgi:Ser/Thr protein kinase RdoA (MazF antagonist)
VKFDRRVPVTAITGGEIGRVGKHQRPFAHLRTLGIGVGWLAVAARQRQAAGDEGEQWEQRSSGQRWRGIGREASLEHREAGRRVLVVRGRPRWPAHGGQEVVAGGAGQEGASAGVGEVVGG